jgi:hypothetical protein
MPLLADLLFHSDVRPPILRDWGSFVLQKTGFLYLQETTEMIYLQNTTESQVMFIPRNGVTPQGDLVFKAKSTIDLEVEINQVVTDLQTSDLYFNLAVTLNAGLPDGEYEYSLSAGEILVSSGLLVIGENSRPSEYNKDITYEQYETE